MTERIAADSAGVEQAAGILRAGGLVAFPTDTVYGIGCRAGDDAALGRLFAAKRRPAEKAIPWLVAAAGDLATAGFELTAAARRLTDSFWPGALTVVLRTRAGDRTQAFRVPNHPIARTLLTLAGPLATSSANRSGEPETLEADDVMVAFADAEVGELDAVLDGGRVPGGVASSVVDLSAERPRLLREGALSRAEIEALIGPID